MPSGNCESFYSSPKLNSGSRARNSSQCSPNLTLGTPQLTIMWLFHSKRSVCRNGNSQFTPILNSVNHRVSSSRVFLTGSWQIGPQTFCLTGRNGQLGPGASQFSLAVKFLRYELELRLRAVYLGPNLPRSIYPAFLFIFPFCNGPCIEQPFGQLSVNNSNVMHHFNH